MNESVIDRTYRSLDTLRSSLPDLRDALLPGSRRRWAQLDLTPEQRARLDHLAREERAAKEETLRRGLSVPGSSPAPLRVDVLDTITEIDTSVTGIESLLCEWFGLTPLAGATTADRITRAVTLLDRVAAHDELADWLDQEARRLLRLARRALDDSEPVRRLDARCPHCSARSLRALPDREVIVCVNTACRCAEAECECHADRPGRHRWVFAEWPELADQLAEVEAAA